VGGVRTALFNYLFARRHGGQFLLRIEDTDQTRFVPGAEDYILEALAWCGITPDLGPHTGGPDAPYRQSERKPMYRQYAEQLIEAGHAYYAFDTEAELDEMRERLKAAGNSAPQYNYVTREYMHNSLRLPADEVSRRLAAGDPYVVRVKVPRKEEIKFYDEIRGWVTVSTTQMDDKVLLKSDGMPTYHLANIVDDHLMRITHVIRGEEWLPSAPLHVLLYRLFGWEQPKFAHLPLLLSPDGSGKLSKRDGDKHGFPIFPLDWTDPATGQRSSGYREAGYLPEAFVNFLALLGWNPGTDREIFTLDELAEVFSLDRVGKSGVKFDKKKSVWFNQHYLRQLSDADLAAAAAPFIERAGLHLPADLSLERIVALLRERAEYLTDFAAQGAYFFADPTAFDEKVVAKRWTTEGAAHLAALHDRLAALPDWTAAALKAETEAYGERAGSNLGQLMPLLRLATTGVGFGPELFELLEVLGRERVLRRLAAAPEHLGVPA
jgi:glutamyl-tRNA synthetase